MSNALKMNVVQLIVMKFSDNEVVDAKNIMCKNSDNILQYKARKDSQYRSEKFVHAEDIYDGIKKLSDANKLPLYVTDWFGLSRLPKIDAEDITNVSIAEKMSSFERKFATFDCYPAEIIGQFQLHQCNREAQISQSLTVSR